MKSTVIQFETIPLLEDSNQTNSINMMFKTIEEEDDTAKMLLENYQNTEIPLNLDLYTSHVHVKGQDSTSYKKSEKKTNTTDDVEKGKSPACKPDNVTFNLQTSFFQKDDVKRIRKETTYSQLKTTLNGVFAKNERGYRLSSKNYRW